MLVKISDLHKLIKQMSSTDNNIFSEVIAPVSSGNNTEFFFRKVNSSDEIIVTKYRSVDPVKILLYNIREQVYPLKEKDAKRIVFGVKACDLHALLLLDKALINNEFKDQAYKQWRESTYIVSFDCTDTHSTCNCIIANGRPYPDIGFDLNLSPVGEFYFITIGSIKGEELYSLINKNCEIFEATNSDRMKTVENRKEMIVRVENQNRKYLPHDDYDNLRFQPSELWMEASADCVNCGACTNICPTCYCLILNEESTAEDFIKVRSYDSCQLNGYAKVAGGASPRPMSYQRFRNRYLCKLDYMKSNFGEIGCTGCGRCTETCTAKIDFREVIYNIQYSPATIQN